MGALLAEPPLGARSVGALTAPELGALVEGMALPPRLGARAEGDVTAPRLGARVDGAALPLLEGDRDEGAEVDPRGWVRAEGVLPADGVLAPLAAGALADGLFWPPVAGVAARGSVRGRPCAPAGRVAGVLTAGDPFLP